MKMFERKIVVEEYEIVDSTMEYLYEREPYNKETIIVIKASQQLKGKGRKNRSWYSPKGGLYLTLILYPAIPNYLYQFIAGVATAKSIEKTTNYKPMLKWPNDIYTSDYSKKIGGILVKAIEIGEKTKLGIGIGINVNNDPPKNMEIPAESLKNLIGKNISLKRLQKELLREFVSIEKIAMQNSQRFWDTYKSYNGMIGKKVIIYYNEKILVGVVEDISTEGKLIIIDNKGKKQEIVEASIRIVL